MLTRLRIRNFKCFDEVDVELGRASVLIGPNNSGKTTALQALALWEIGVRRWSEKRMGGPVPKKRQGVTVNRRDLASIPVPYANLLWRGLHVRNIERIEKDGAASTRTNNIRIDILVDGITRGKSWTCGMEFDYANAESFYCRPLRDDVEATRRMEVPQEATEVEVCFLPPMSGLADREHLKQPGEIGMLIGQGQTAQVLRNLCFRVSQEHPEGTWATLVEHIQRLFGIILAPPKFIAERAEIAMSYTDGQGVELDLSSSGRGLQQTLLLLAYLYANPGAVLLLDEPDAHLEILRQRQTYNLLIEVAEQQGSQIIAASHSEVVLNEAAGRDTVLAFIGRPHRLDEGPSQVLKSLRDIGFEHYLQAKETGWVLFLENSTDLAILRAFATVLHHKAQEYLARPYVKYIETNLPTKAREHFFGLVAAKSDLVGIAIFDRLEGGKLREHGALTETMWKRREIENYFCTEGVLLAYTAHDIPNDLFGRTEREQRRAAMREAIDRVSSALRDLGKPDPWSADIKATDEFLDPLFRNFFARLELPLQLRKSDYHVLAGLASPDALDPEITEKLDAIVATAERARSGA